MKNIVYLYAAILVSAWLLLPIPKIGEHGATNIITGLSWCDEDWACRHEIGHKLDRRAGWISQSPEFSDAVMMYVLSHARVDEELPVYILAMTYSPKDGQEPTKAELYAFIYEYSNGDPLRLPVGLRPFFDWDYGRELMKGMQ